ncbi:uroporphyrinogen-III C-methyltransferase [Diaphorobacter ruginosibacter]|uniref:Uroporphyrinogen-III C-methyltransferase n=1 Tax=Diaphorobacter ruginosibacter TaxID=1715720 RepID=A0A7G9RSB4_9BURK|nr:uroporphyrinogen-III C-methyltransferase [Diaphorobacter ruginosibacter]QNN58489.1 uroporphyrinogen-III C-methyltransferase [Diaphorobacter ruginosibacter]
MSLEPQHTIHEDTPDAPATSPRTAAPVPPSAASAAAAPSYSAAPAHAAAQGGSRLLLTAVGAVAVAGLVSSVMLWQKLSNIQEQLARQTADSGTQAIEARTMARQAADVARETSARLSVTEARVGEVALQRTQLEELMQSLSRSRDENLVVDIESGLRLAIQQSQLTGSLEPVIAALKSADQRIERAAQPRLAPVQRAIAHDLEKLNRSAATDTSGLLGRVDDLTRQVDEIPLLNAVISASTMRQRNASARSVADQAATPADPEAPRWKVILDNAWEAVAGEARGLVRVSRIDQPDAVLIAPQQAYFLRENLKLSLMNARLGILSRRLDSARLDLTTAKTALIKYFDPESRYTQRAIETISQLQTNMQSMELPRLDETFASLTTAAAGR